MTRGMPAEAIAAIDFEQPYNMARRAPEAGPQSVDALFALSALQNSDKHRNLAVLVPGISLPTARIFWQQDGRDEALGITSPRYLEEGAEVVRWAEFGNRIPYKDVRVTVSGTSRVSVSVSDRGDFELVPLAGGILGRVRDRVLPNLEPLVRA